VVAAVADLPRSVAGGSCASAAGVGFPLALADVSAKWKPEEAYPALVMGTQVCGVASHLHAASVTATCLREVQQVGKRITRVSMIY
jgi:hypothetical protein